MIQLDKITYKLYYCLCKDFMEILNKLIQKKFGFLVN